MDKSKRELLPNNVRPTHYNIFLFPDLEKFTFEGNVDIDLNVNEDSTVITTNAYDMTIHSASITDVASTEKQDATDIKLDATAQTLQLTFANTLKKGSKAKLSIKFTGNLNNEMDGFYRSEYTDSNGQKKYMAVTQFESVYARRSFPCWDEPAIKATFDIKLRAEVEKTTLSNMPIIKEEKLTIDGKEYKDVTFDTTPIMSTYLVAYIVGELEYVETMSNPTSPAEAKPIKVRVYTLKGESSQGKYSAEVTARVLEYFSEYFNIPYPLPKMDLVAIPDFEAGAMENWGLVTFRTVALLFDETKSSAASKERVCTTVAHELAHQWFGNLVTIGWWSDLWLNEGFATFVGTLATDHLNPEWKIFTSFVVDDLQSALNLDGLRSSHPVQVEVNKATEVDQIFDQISYEKGATIIRMLNACLGEQKFMDGIRIYLKRHMYSNTETSDLWKALSESSGIDVETLMGSWIKDVGYPVVTIENYKENNNEFTLSLSQKRFLSSGDMTPEEEAKYATWWIPLGITTHASPNKPIESIFTEKKQEITVPYPESSNKFIKLNFNETGMYRVKYPEEILKSIGEMIKAGLEDKSKEVIGVSDRIGIIADIFALARNGTEHVDNALELLQYFEKETDYNVLSQIFAKVNDLKSVWYNQNGKLLEALKKLVLKIFSPLAEKYGFEYSPNDNYIEVMTRTLVLKAASVYGDQKIIDEIIRRLELYIKGDNKALNPNLRKLAYTIALSNTTGERAEKFYNDIFHIYQSSDVPDQSLIALQSLGSAKDTKLIKRTFDLALNTELIRLQDIMYCIISLTVENPNVKETRPAAWKWMVENWPIFEERYKTSGSILGHISRLCTNGLNDTEHIKEIEAWVAEKGSKLDIIRRPINQIIERLKGQNAWIKRDNARVQAWAENYLAN
jgi:aminopeptidase 2